MTWLRQRWYQIGWSAELEGGRLLVRTILEEPIVVFRSGDGQLQALFDRCPHRFAPLSRGTIGERGIACGYHGLSFGKDGQCIANPHGPVTSRMRARAYPVMERHTAIWVWMGDPERADPLSLPDLSFIDETPTAAQIHMYMPTKANYELAADNILDLSHTDYLHPTSLGGIMTGSKARTWEQGDALVTEWHATACDPPPAYKPIVPTGKADIWTQVTWHAPALMVLGTSAKPTGVPRQAADEAYTLHNMVPETSTTTHYFVCNTRRFMLDSTEFSELLRGAITHAFQDEDKPMLEDQQLRMGTPDLWELDPILLPVDAGAIRVRRKLAAMIQAEHAEADAQIELQAESMPV
jgi:vanillate O-demethylase monooxygenase subunit